MARKNPPVAEPPLCTGKKSKEPRGGVEVMCTPRGTARRTTLLDKAAPPQAEALLAGAVRLSAKVDPVGATLRIAIGTAVLKKVPAASIRLFRFESSNGSLQLVPHSSFDAATLDGGDPRAASHGEPGGASVLLPTGDVAEWPRLAMGLKGNHKTRYIVAKMGTDSG